MNSEPTSTLATSLFEKMREVREERSRLSQVGNFTWEETVEQEARRLLNLPMPYDPFSESASTLFDQFEERLRQEERSDPAQMPSS